MITEADIKSYLSELFYIQEDVLNMAKKEKIPKSKKDKILDNINQKQVILTKIIDLLVYPKQI